MYVTDALQAIVNNIVAREINGTVVTIEERYFDKVNNIKKKPEKEPTADEVVANIKNKLMKIGT